MTHPDRENSSAQEGSTTVNNDLSLDDRDFLQRLCRILPRIVQDDSRGQDDKGVQTSDKLPELQAEAELFTKQGGGSKASGMLSINPKPDAFKVFQVFESKCERTQSKLAQLNKVLRRIAGANDALKEVQEMSSHLDSFKELLRSNVDLLTEHEMPGASTLAIEAAFNMELSTSLSRLARSSWALSHSLEDLCDGVLDSDCLTPLDRLALLVESTAKDMQDVDGALGSHERGKAQQRIVELMPRLGNICDELTTGLSKFIEQGFPILVKIQQREMSKHLNLSFVALLFSIIIAIMLAASVSRASSSLHDSVVGCWFISLIFGVSSTVNSLLGLVWSQSFISSRRQFMPWLATNWLETGPMISFALAAVLFSIGLCMFAFTASQSNATGIAVTTFAAMHFVVLMILVAWYLVEHEQFNAGLQSFRLAMHNLATASIRALGSTARLDAQDVEQGPDVIIEEQTHQLGPKIEVSDTEAMTFSHGVPSSTEMLSTSRSHLAPHSNLSGQALGSHTPSGSSRSLPPLPNDAQLIRCMSYSPNGMFLCIGNSSAHEPCMIFSADSPAITLGELQLIDVAHQVEWSPDGEYILLRLKSAIYVWNAMPAEGSKRPFVIIHQQVENIKWIPHEDAFLACQDDTLTKYDVHGDSSGFFKFPLTSILDFTVIQDGNHVICLVETASTSSTRSHSPSFRVKKLLDFNLARNAVEVTIPVESDARSLTSSAAFSGVLVTFLADIPPQLWYYGSSNIDKRTSASFGLSSKRVMHFRAPPSARFYGTSVFGGSDDKLIISLGSECDAMVFSRETGELLRQIHAPHSQFGTPMSQCVAWDPDIVSFAICISYTNGSIWQWKTSFDDLNQNASTASFAVVMLNDEDSTLIRASGLPD